MRIFCTSEGLFDRANHTRSTANVLTFRIAYFWSRGAAGAQVPYKDKVAGSNPAATTI